MTIAMYRYSPSASMLTTIRNSASVDIKPGRGSLGEMSIVIRNNECELTITVYP